MTKAIRGRNEGSLYKQSNGTWRAQVSVDGKRLSKLFKTKGEGQAWLKQITGLVDDGISYESSQMKLGEYLEEWLRMTKHNRRPKTHLSYRRLADRYILPAFANHKLRDLRPHMIQQFLTNLQESGVGDRTCQIVYATLHAVMESAYRIGMVVRNPLVGVAKPRVKVHRRIVTLQPEQVQQFLIAAENHRSEALYFLAITTGLRQGELLGLKWSDLDWQRGWLRVQRQVHRVDGAGLVFSEPKTQFGNRVIALGPTTVEKLREHRTRQEQQREITGTRWNDLDLVFPTTIGTPRDPHNLLKEFKALLKKADLPSMRFHDLRHTSVTLILNELGASVKEAQHRAGHASPSTTINIYAGMTTTRTDERVARELDELITPVRFTISPTAQELHTNCTQNKRPSSRKAS